MMMSQWLKPDVDSMIQPYATHQIGVGGFVLNSKEEVLVVRESNEGDWKLPGGIAELGEEFGETAEREVFEETGVLAVFESLVGFRHQHQTAFGRSNLYFVALMQLAQETETEISMCESELIAAQWMPLQEYLSWLNRPAASAMNLTIAQLVAGSSSAGAGRTAMEQQQLIVEEVLPKSKRSKGGVLYYAGRV